MIITLIWQSNFYLLDQFCLESLASMASLGKFMAVLCKTFESQKKHKLRPIIAGDSLEVQPFI